MPPPGYRSLVEAALPGTYGELIERTGLAESTVKRWIKIMRAEGLVSITAWRRCIGNAGHGGRYMPRFAVCSRPDVPCPFVRLTSTESSTMHRDRLKKSGEWAHKLATWNARKWARKAQQQGDPLVNALFGRN